MIDSDFETRLRNLNKLIGDDVPDEEVLAEALALKKEMSAHLIRLNLLINTMDHLVASFAPSPTWYWGWLPADQLGTASTSGPLPKYDRGTRVPEVAAMLGESGGVVLASDITERLRSEGENLPDKALATAIGNILHRTRQWKRVGRGMYRRIEVPANGREAFDSERSQAV
jgi:hypothetical protein